MMPRFLPTDLPGVILVEPELHHDDRGFFLETHHTVKYANGGIDCSFVQDNHSRSCHRTLRGLHAQLQHPQAKLVRVTRGEIYDVAVDIRRGSATFGVFAGALLSSKDHRQLFIPAGFAHGFCVLSDYADVEYKCSTHYAPSDEIVISWNDPEIGIPWPIDHPILSERDRSALPLRAHVRLPNAEPAKVGSFEPPHRSRSFDSLVASYARGLETTRRALRTERIAGNVEALSVLVHRIRGTASSYGFPEVSAAAADCETALRSGASWTEVEPLCNTLESVVARFEVRT